MSWVRVWIHMVFSTKNAEHYLSSQKIREEFFKHIKENAETKGIWLDTLNGYQEHAHCLISLGKDQTISNIAQLIKGESSFWINHHKLIPFKFQWQDDYWAVSVSENNLNAVRSYIINQEEHHRKKTFTEEVDEFVKKYGWEIIKKAN